MKAPLVTAELVAYMEIVYDNKPRKDDNKATLVWKAGQRDIVESLKQLHKRQSGELSAGQRAFGADYKE